MKAPQGAETPKLSTNSLSKTSKNRARNKKENTKISIKTELKSVRMSTPSLNSGIEPIKRFGNKHDPPENPIYAGLANDDH